MGLYIFTIQKNVTAKIIVKTLSYNKHTLNENIIKRILYKNVTAKIIVKTLSYNKHALN